MGNSNLIYKGTTIAQKLLPENQGFVIDISYDSWHLIFVAAGSLVAAQKEKATYLALFCEELLYHVVL